MLEIKEMKAWWSDDLIRVVIEGKEVDFSDVVGELDINDPLLPAAIVMGTREHPKVERAIFNGPATFVFWDDGEKTVVKCSECLDGGCKYLEGDSDVLEEGTREAACLINDDREKAVMAAMLKRLYKNYQDVLREALGEESGR